MLNITCKNYFFRLFLFAIILLWCCFSIDAVYGQCTPQITDGFDYPIGSRGYCDNGNISPILENINPEQNPIYPNNPIANPRREGLNPSGGKWYNINDIGNFLNLDDTYGIHPGEDWNKGTGSNDAGEIVHAIANGKIVRVSSAFDSYLSGGYTIVIQHTLPNNTSIYSVYTHITSLNNTNGTLATNANQFLLSDNVTSLLNSCINRGTPIGRIARGMTAIIYPHLHFEIRTTIANVNSLYPNDNGNGYYGATVGQKHTSSMTQAQVTSAFGLMQTDGYIDPSDFIDNNRPLFINDNTSIYGGVAGTSKSVKFYFYRTGTISANDIKAGGIAKKVRIGTPENPSYADVMNVSNHSANPDMKIVTINTPTSGVINGNSYDIAFSIDSQIYRANKSVYFLDPLNATNYQGLSDPTKNVWQYYYVWESLRRGFIRNLNNNINLTKGEAATIIVKAALELSHQGLLNGSDEQPFRIRAEITGNAYNDVSMCHPFFPYIQTLRNYGYIGSGVNGNFGVDNAVTLGDVCRIVSNVFRLTINSKQPKHLGSKTLPSPDEYIARVQKTFVVRKSIGTAVRIVEYAITNSSNPNLTSENALSIDPNSQVNRSTLSKILVNVYDAKANGDAGNKSTSDIDKFTIIGDKFELADNPSGANPTTSLTGSTTMDSGEIRDFGYPNTTLNGSPMYFYWSVDDGKLESLTTKYNQVRFTAPTVTASITVSLYSLIGTADGKIGEAYLTITVKPKVGNCNPFTATASNNSNANTCPGATIQLSATIPSGASITWSGPNGYQSSQVNPSISNITSNMGGYYYAKVTLNGCSQTFSTLVNVNTCATPPATPTSQASNITFSNTELNGTRITWQRGNGERCLVVVSSTPISQSPTDGQAYTISNDYAQAGVVGSQPQRAVYFGGANSVYIYGLLASNTNPWYVAIYEVNGTGSQTKYLKTNPATGSVIIPIIIPTVNFGTDPEIIVSGQPTYFYSLGSNQSSWNWTFNGANVSSATSDGVSNVIFNNAGNYDVTLSVNSPWGGTNSITKNIRVLNANDLKPDLIIQNQIIGNNNTMEMGQPFNISCEIVNLGVNTAQVSWVRYFFSVDNILDEFDDKLGEHFIDKDINGSSTVTINKTFTYPTFQGEGEHYIFIITDHNNLVNESNETNNMITQKVKSVFALPDFAISNLKLSTNTIHSGGQLTITYDLANFGSFQGMNGVHSTYLNFYVSKDNVYNSGEDIGVGFKAISNLYNGTSLPNQTSNLPIQQIVKDGNWYILGILDDNNSIPELNENNNVKAIPIIISSPNQPNTQAKDFKLSDITATSVKLTWANGNGAGRVVIAKKNYAIFYSNSSIYNEFPADGQFYANANSNWQNAPKVCEKCDNVNYPSRVVYKGTGNNVNITNLDPNVSYYFAVFEYKETNGTIDYLQSKPYEITTMINNNAPSSIWKTVFNGGTGGGRSIFVTKNKQIFAGFGSRIGKSTDDGRTWLTNNPEGNTNINIYDIQFLDNNIGFAIPEGGANIYKTNDAGITWTQKKTNIPSSAIPTSCYFVNQSIGFLTTSGGGLNTNGLITKTTDGGETWNVVYTSPYRLWDIQFVNENIGWAVGGGFFGIILKTTDGGNTWFTQPVTAATPNGLNSVYFVNENIGWIADSYNGRIHKTIDGGNTWFTQTTLSNSGSESRLFFLNEKIGYVVGYSMFAKTTDGGTNWKSFFTEYGGFIDLFAVDENEVWVKNFGVIAKTNTGGESIGINRPILNNSVLCEGSSFDLPFEIIGSFNSGNSFQAELSDAQGSFDNPYILGTISSINKGTINCKLPSGKSGLDYKIRIKASNPSIVGASSSPITIQNKPDANFTGLLPTYCMGVTNIVLQPLTLGGVFSGKGIANNVFNPTQAGVGIHTITYAINQNGCSATYSQSVEVIQNSISISSANGQTSVCEGESLLLSVNNPTLEANYQWRFNGSEISGANDFMYFANQAGSYNLVSVFGGCLLVSNTITFSKSSISKPNISKDNDNPMKLVSSATTGNQWYLNGNIIPNATSQTYTATVFGDYTVKVTNTAGCSAISDVYKLDATTALEDNLLAKSIKIAPNPSTGEFSLKFENFEFEQISFQIYDNRGRLIEDGKIDLKNNEAKLNINHLSAGTYNLVIKTAKGEAMKRIIKY
ncbi:MAG: T9SS type A sorting domain-containing protein [Microscillaceae bacterium]|jgi:photosystem II stability/assembly factor-like uncharacterized protein|nr:T9SS type A sorting domain-containing protein [Microscillaceae bacterium]